MAGIVLIAIDSSPQAEAAFEWYMDHLHSPGNSLVILHSIDLSKISEDGESSSDVSQSFQLTQSKMKALEDKYRWKLNEIGISGKIRHESGKPGEVIIKASKEESARLIVIGSRGLGRLQRTLSGSVSDYVLHHATCPVVICRQQE